MELSSLSITELIRLYSGTIKELKNRGVLRTKNVVGEIGEYLVLEYYEKTPSLPNLSSVPLGTKNINAISQDGERYSIKSTSGNVTGVFYGLQPQGSSEEDKPVFEYVIVCKLDDDYELEGIYQLDWDHFQKHKKWHSRMNAWNITITNAMKADSTVIFDRKANVKEKGESFDDVALDEEIEEFDEEISEVITWNKTEKVKHPVVREAIAEKLKRILGGNFEKTSQSRYVSSDRASALFVLSASYSEKNGEYWYSINDENIPWLKLFPTCHIAFAMGGAENVLVFPYDKFTTLLDGCLRTKEDASIKKKAHYHFSFAVEGSKVFFKKKVPEKELIDVSEFLM